MDPSLFVQDSIGDIEAAKYGSAEKSKVPRYRRRGDRVVGLDEGLRIADTQSSSGELAITPGGSKRVRYTDLDSRSKIYLKYPKRLRVDALAVDAASGAPFISVQNTKVYQEQPQEDIYIDHQFAGTNHSSPSDNDSSDEEHNLPSHGIQDRLRSLDASVRSDAADVASWLALAALQKDLLEAQHEEAISQAGKSAEGVRSSQAKLQRSIAEVQFAVLERASKAHPRNVTSLPLMLAKLELASSNNLWDYKRLQKEWRQSIHVCSANWHDSFRIWHGYLRWRASDGDAFIFEKVLEDFSAAIEDLLPHFFVEQSAEDRAVKEVHMLEIIDCTLQLLFQTGYTERALGLLQALCELTFRRPAIFPIHTALDFQQACDRLEDYWDLNDEHVGNGDSPDWFTFSNNVRDDPRALIAPPLSENDKPPVSFGSILPGLTASDPVVRWLSLEVARGKLRFTPAKSNEEADWTTGELEVDPFSFVFFADLRPFIIPIKSERGKILLVEIFLSFLGIPNSNTSRFYCRLSLSDDFWPRHLSSPVSESTWEVIDGEAMQRTKASALNNPFNLPFKIWPSRLNEMYASHLDEALLWFAQWTPLNLDDQASKLAKTLLSQVAHSATSLNLAQLGLSEATHTHKATSKLAKQLLSRDRDNCNLWLALARLERNAGNTTPARTVYRSLLVAEAQQSSKSLSCVWAEWAELEWESGRHESALHVLTLAAKAGLRLTTQEDIAVVERRVSSLEILRTRRFYDQIISQLDVEGAALDCAALFRYLTAEADEAFDSVNRTFESVIATNKGRSEIEKIAMSHCKFTWRHIYGTDQMKRSRRYKPKQITDLLVKYVLEFPHNTAFVALLAAFEMTTKVENVLRRTLEARLLILGDDIWESDWLIYIYCELHINLYAVNENAVRRLFERALEAKSTSSSSLLWQSYLDFEIQISRRKTALVEQGRERLEKEPSSKDVLRSSIRVDGRQAKSACMRAKSILYRSIQKVPFCKALYMAAFAPPLRDVFPTEELLQLSRLMQEKDLRFFTDLQSYVAPPESNDSDDSGSSSRSE